MDAYLEAQILGDTDIANFFRTPAGALRAGEDWYYSSTSLGIGPNKAVPRRPYIVVNELADFVHHEVKETSNSRTRNFQIFVYDEVGDFTRINSIMKALRTRIKAMNGFVTGDGVRCSGSQWNGISARIQNDGYDSIARFASVQFTVSE